MMGDTEPVACFQSSRTDLTCRACGERPGVIHIPTRYSGYFCEKFLWPVKIAPSRGVNGPEEENPNPKDQMKATGCKLAGYRMPKRKSRI
jgi:hypothetical protein